MPAAVVADASISAAWCFPDERTGFTEAVLDALTTGDVEILAPHLWAYEVRNSVLMGVRRGRISMSHPEAFLETLQDIPVRFAEPPFHEVFRLAIRYGLTVYDAA